MSDRHDTSAPPAAPQHDRAHFETLAIRAQAPMSAEHALPDDPPPAEPLPPDESACCGSGCDPCVWDFFNEERRQWQADLAAWRARQAARLAVAAPDAPSTP